MNCYIITVHRPEALDETIYIQFLKSFLIAIIIIVHNCMNPANQIEAWHF